MVRCHAVRRTALFAPIPGPSQTLFPSRTPLRRDVERINRLLRFSVHMPLASRRRRRNQNTTTGMGTRTNRPDRHTPPLSTLPRSEGGHPYGQRRFKQPDMHPRCRRCHRGHPSVKHFPRWWGHPSVKGIFTVRTVRHHKTISDDRKLALCLGYNPLCPIVL